MRDHRVNALAGSTGLRWWHTVVQRCAQALRTPGGKHRLDARR